MDKSIKVGDRFEHPSPLWKSLEVEFTGEIRGGTGVFKCTKAVREPFVTRNAHWEVDKTGLINLATLKRLWMPINKSSHFQNLYDKLSQV